MHNSSTKPNVVRTRRIPLTAFSPVEVQDAREAVKACIAKAKAGELTVSDIGVTDLQTGRVIVSGLRQTLEKIGGIYVLDEEFGSKIFNKLVRAARGDEAIISTIRINTRRIAATTKGFENICSNQKKTVILAKIRSAQRAERLVAEV